MRKYKFYGKCNNCRREYTLKFPMGIRVEDYQKENEILCPICDCDPGWGEGENK